MAQAANEFYEEVETGPLPRVARATIATKKFAAGSGTLLAGTMVAYQTTTGFFVPWINGGANGAAVMKGIVFPDSIVLDAAGEVDGDVMIRGLINYNDIFTPTNAVDAVNNTAANIKTELQEEARLLGIDVQGLASVR